MKARPSNPEEFRAAIVAARKAWRAATPGNDRLAAWHAYQELQRAAVRAGFTSEDLLAAVRTGQVCERRPELCACEEHAALRQLAEWSKR